MELLTSLALGSEQSASDVFDMMQDGEDEVSSIVILRCFSRKCTASPICTPLRRYPVWQRHDNRIDVTIEVRRKMV